jgi:hypothetical protein
MGAQCGMNITRQSWYAGNSSVVLTRQTSGGKVVGKMREKTWKNQKYVSRGRRT